MSEDILDNRRWCRVCETSEHSECEPPPAYDFECIVCDVKIPDAAYDYDGIGFCNKHRPDGVQISGES